MSTTPEAIEVRAAAERARARELMAEQKRRRANRKPRLVDVARVPTQEELDAAYLHMRECDVERAAARNRAMEADMEAADALAEHIRLTALATPLREWLLGKLDGHIGFGKPPTARYFAEKSGRPLYETTAELERLADEGLIVRDGKTYQPLPVNTREYWS